MKTITPIFKGEILNLDKIQVYYEDRDPNSSIFGISGISNVLSKGNHSLFINPTETAVIDTLTEQPLRLKKSTSVKIEIIDKVGTRAYLDFPTQAPIIRNINGVKTLVNADFSSGYRGPDFGGVGLAATFLIDDRLADGTGKLIMVGELEGVPNKWKGVYNVRWERPITIQKSAINKSQLYFYKSPTVTISEFVTPYFSQSSGSPTASNIVNGAYELKSIKKETTFTYNPNSQTSEPTVTEVS